MIMKKVTIDDYVSGNEPLPGTFTTGYKRDLAIAREIVRKRQNSGADARLVSSGAANSGELDQGDHRQLLSA